MQSGQGGIRWNSATNWVQLQDENKNWVDYRYYNPTKLLTHEVFNYTSGTAFTVQLNKRGLYCLTSCGPSAVQMTTDAQVVSTVNKSGNSSVAYEQIVYSDGSCYATVGNGGGDYATMATCIYIGNYTTVSTGEANYYANSTSVYEFNYTHQNDFIHLSLSGLIRNERTFRTTNIEEPYISVKDPGVRNSYSGCCINHNGSVYIAASPGPYNSSIGTMLVTRYSLVN